MNRRQILYRIFNSLARLVMFLRPKKDISMDLMEVRSRLHGTVDVFKWQLRNLRYKSDEFNWEHWKAPLKTFIDKFGDCEDWAILAYFFLKTKVKNITILCMYPPSRNGHATCLVNDNITIANWGIVHHNSSNPFQISKYFMNDCNKIEYYTLNFNEDGNVVNKKIIKELTKPQS